MTNRLQPIYDIAALCAARNVRQAVLCPGSRNAPLILAFARHPDMVCRSISDERSAAFIALGITQQTRRPSALISTSGSAAYNFAPAVAEAFFAKTPLVVITADRPVEWVGQQDGQTIFQSGIFGAHVKKFYQLPQEYEHPDNVWSINRMVNEAISLAATEPKGPVHINVPLREPLYPGNRTTGYSPGIRVIEESAHGHNVDTLNADLLASGMAKSNRVLILAGQHPAEPSLAYAVRDASQRLNLPIVADVLSNLHPTGRAIQRADLFLGAVPESVRTALGPDLLITFGDSLISKHVKNFLRTHRPLQHWHIQPAGEVADTLQSITKIFRTSPLAFFRLLADEKALAPGAGQAGFMNRWLAEEQRTVQTYESCFPQTEPGEAELVAEVLRRLPSPSNVHLANSMSVRYATLAGLNSAATGVCVYANRGTSGIDGCNSTAVGHALTSSVLNVLITGDVAFFYDRNAFWHNYPMPNLRIVLLNNHGGGIFKMIDGPGDIREVDEFLVTRQPLTGQKICEEFGFGYSVLDTRQNMEQAVAELLQPSERPKLLELNSSVLQNRNILFSIKQKIKDSYER